MESATRISAPSAVDPSTPGDGLILDPNSYAAPHLDPADEARLRATIEWFEARGKVALKDADRENRWYSDYLEMQASEGIFAKFLPPARDGGGDAERRWDTQRICQFSEVSAFYGLAHWYTWQVTILGLGPSSNPETRRRARRPRGSSRRARSSRSASPNAPTAPTSTRPT